MFMVSATPLAPTKKKVHTMTTPKQFHKPLTIDFESMSTGALLNAAINLVGEPDNDVAIRYILGLVTDRVGTDTLRYVLAIATDTAKAV
jgi:hypothetical protein